MLRVPVDQIQPGMVLARPIPAPSDPRRNFLPRDSELTADAILRLRELGVQEVWVRYRNLEFLESFVDEELGQVQRDVYANVRRAFESIMRDAAAELDVRRFHDAISALFHILKENAQGNVLLQKIDAFDNYLISHSANVCYLSLLLGMKLDEYFAAELPSETNEAKRNLQVLGLGCLLHDVGKLRVPLEMLNKPGPLTETEMDEVKLHTVYGYEMVRGRVPAEVEQVVLHHHQRWAGGGYPQTGRTPSGRELPEMWGNRIPVVARIAAICDVYDALTSRRAYCGPKLPVQALYEMRACCRGFFDPVVEQCFREVIPPFPIGQVVTLSDGVDAAVVDFNPLFPSRPKVQCIRTPDGEAIDDPAREEIDLSIESHLEIVAVDGHDVRKYATTPRETADLALVFA
jgi:HD-GYP domain-containing protein (c-di-GMP phosphodiesterase class II)